MSYSSFYRLELYLFTSQKCVLIPVTLFFIASCHGLALGGSLDEIVRWLSRYRTGLRSLDAWRSGHFTNQGIEMLSGLQSLQELDIGWWYVDSSFKNHNSGFLLINLMVL